MQAVSHSLTHRGSSASRTRARWQPYASIQPSSMRTPSGAYLHTPVSSSSTVSTPAPAPHNSICESDLTKSLPPARSNTHILSQPSKDIRDVHKHKYVTGLVDAAVRSLCEIWSPHDIPAVFLTQACLMTPSTSMHNILPLNGPSNSSVFTAIAQQLPSPPITPPYLPGTASSPHVSRAPRTLSRAATHIDLSSAEQARGTAAPLKTFVHDVLRRSRTSCSVLQTALCYIEALRSRVPELVQQEQTGEGIRGEVDQGVRVLPPDDPRLLESPKEVDIDEVIDPVHFASSESQFSDDALPTVRMLDELTMPDTTALYQVERKSRTSSEDLPSLPPLPSPLLCPRRTFLASLILASKFMQDKCYSNRAWAKLAGLPAREIGRCERALGEALGWRLWVGKMPAYCMLPRSQSAGEICRAHYSSDAPSPAANVVRRSRTLPAHAPSFSAMATQPVNPATSICTRMQGPWIPMPEATAFEYSPTPTLSASPATTDASSDSINERTVQMTFVDHVSDPDGLKENTPAILPALAYAYAGEGGISRAWCGFAWNATGPAAGWVRGDGDTLPLQY
ncbi:hypothetical protein DFH94DRAFT_378328 [Russula ochroleuca]|jgi:hypothetical protein|uniref:Uncharacterized protein n=1 Tax=Russula ochroleuca TaxID=152965 RepID=A0A9P5MZQ4_9AGAM|nr:hypothetical protein DFH94DRAFT_378328 [Russula ochroleuca]